MLRAAVLVAFLLFAPQAALAHEGHCPPETEATIDVSPIYVADDGVYQESNGIVGLQRHSGSCDTETNENVRWIADTQVIGL